MFVSVVRRWFGGTNGATTPPVPAIRSIDVVLLAGLVALALWLTGFVGAGFGEPIQHSAGEDWDWQLTLYASSARALTEFHRFPTWNPYTAGGVPLWANPEFPGFHPAFALVAWAGPEAGIKLLVLVHLVLGWAGLVLLGRQLGLRRPLDVLPVLLIAGCSVWNYRLVWGHVTFLGFAYLPWAWWFLLRARGRTTWAGAAGLALGLSLLAGAPQVYLIGLVTTVTWALLRVSASPRRALLALGALLLPAGLIGLGRWLPLVLAAGDADRMTVAADAGALGSYGVWDLVRVWAGAAPLQGEHESQPTFHGWLPVVLLIPGIAVALRRHRGLLAVFGVALILSLANNLPVNPYRLLQSIPGLEHFRYPERFALAYAPLLALLAALGAQAALGSIRRLGRLPALVGALVLTLFAAWHGVRCLPAEAERWGLLTGTYALPGEVSPSAGAFRQDPDAEWNYHTLLRGQGCPACRDALGLPAPALPWGRALVDVAGEAEIHLTTFAGSAADVHLTLGAPARLTVRQAARPGWRAEVDGVARTLPSGPRWIQLDLDAGEHRVDLRYSPPGAGLAVASLVAAPLLVLGMWVVTRRRSFGGGRGPG